MVNRSRLQSTPSPSRRICAADGAAGFALPVPDLVDEQLAAEVFLGLAVDGELLLHHALGGDARVVHAGQPQHLVALHALAPGQRVHQRVVERVAHVQAAGHVRRRQHDRIRRLAAGRVGLEVAGVDPALVQVGSPPRPDPTTWAGRQPWASAGSELAVTAPFYEGCDATSGRSGRATSCRRAGRRGSRRSRCSAAAAAAEHAAQDAAERIVPAAAAAAPPPRMLPRMSPRPPPPAAWPAPAAAAGAAALGQLLADVGQHDRRQDRQQPLDQIAAAGARRRPARRRPVAVVAAEDLGDELVALRLRRPGRR